MSVLKQSGCLLMVSFGLISGWTDAPSVVAQEQANSVMPNWITSVRVRRDLQLTKEQQDKIVVLLNELKKKYDEFFSQYPVPRHPYEGPRAGIILDTIEEFKKIQFPYAADFESKLMEVLDAEQQDKLLGDLIRSSGPRSMLESSELRKRLKLDNQQIAKLQAIYFGDYDLWLEMMHDGDLYQHINTPEEVEEHGWKYGLLRQKLVEERIWKVRQLIDDAHINMDEQAMRVITPEQKLLYEKLLSSAPAKDAPAR